MNEYKLIEISHELKPLWKKHCKKYGKAVAKEVRKKMGFWKYYFTEQAINNQFIMLNTSFADGLKNGEIKLVKSEEKTRE